MPGGRDPKPETNCSRVSKVCHLAGHKINRNVLRISVTKLQGRLKC